jgi:hypothetical protein
MSALQILKEGLVTAAELAALLFVPPATAVEPAAAQVRLRTLHLSSTVFDVRLLGALADVRVLQEVRNGGDTAIDLAAVMSVSDAAIDALRIHRSEGSFTLAGDHCAEDLASGPGHVRLAADEAIADALQLLPGSDAAIEWITTLPLARVGPHYRLALPSFARLGPQALLVDQGDAQFLVVVVHPEARGRARLTLRPASAAATTIELGALDAAGERDAFVIPLKGPTLEALAAGAVEFESHDVDRVLWVTLPARLSRGPVPALAQDTH